MLVLLLMTDQIGSPLHRHHHDSGVDGTLSAASALSHLDLQSDLDSHVEDAGHDDHFGHATLAVRPASSKVAQVLGADESAVTLVLPAVLFALLLAPEDSAEPLPQSGWRPPLIRSHRSLPPAGRAPPLLA